MLDQPVPVGHRADRGARARPGGEPPSDVELTEIRTGGQDWWTLGFEATGPVGLLRGALAADAALMFTQALLGGVEPGPRTPSPTRGGWAGRPAPGMDADA